MTVRKDKCLYYITIITFTVSYWQNQYEFFGLPNLIFFKFSLLYFDYYVFLTFTYMFGNK